MYRGIPGHEIDRFWRALKNAVEAHVLESGLVVTLLQGGFGVAAIGRGKNGVSVI